MKNYHLDAEWQAENLQAYYMQKSAIARERSTNTHTLPAELSAIVKEFEGSLQALRRRLHKALGAGNKYNADGSLKNAAPSAG